MHINYNLCMYVAYWYMLSFLILVVEMVVFNVVNQSFVTQSHRVRNRFVGCSGDLQVCEIQKIVTCLHEE